MKKEKDNQKEDRQKAIVDLVTGEAIRTQMELLTRLTQAGFNVTQATISRDIRELQIGKTADAEGNYQYVLNRRQDNMRRFEMIFGETVTGIDYAGHMVMVKCHTGMANAACELFDSENRGWGDVVGTLSGDNTFIVLMRSVEEAKRLTSVLRHYLAT